jgi:hypothetical protein
MIDPRYWLKHASVHRAIRNYPLYDLPHKQAERALDEERVEDNFAYFMGVRLDRLAFFRSWLRTNLRIEVDLDGDGLRKVSRWVDDYGGGLIPDEPNSQTIFANYRPRWENEHAGYNVIIDIGIFLGEYLIAKRPRLFWEIYRGHELEPESVNSSDYLKPCLGGMPRLWKSFPLMTGYGAVRSSRYLALIGHHSASGGILVGIAKSALYRSRLPDGNDAIVLGDSSNEPL